MKWHYYNRNNELCIYQPPSSIATTVRTTACNRSPNKIRLHTEFKSRVTCLQCLHQLNLQTKQKEQKDE